MHTSQVFISENYLLCNFKCRARPNELCILESYDHHNLCKIVCVCVCMGVCAHHFIAMYLLFVYYFFNGDQGFPVALVI